MTVLEHEFPYVVVPPRRSGSELRLRREECFRTLVQAAFEGVVLEGPAGIEEVDESFTRTFGFSSKELRGRRLQDLMISTDVDSPDVHMLRKDGTSLIVKICAVTTCDGESITAIRDVTEERKAQEEILESHQRYRELSESTHDLLCLHDLDGAIFDVNVAAARAIGYTAEELCSMNVRDLLSMKDPAEYDQYIGWLLKNGEAEGLMAIRTRKGERRLWHYQNALRTIGGRTVVHGLARDVTDRETAVHELRRSELHFRSIIENVSDLISVIAPDGALKYVSPSVTRALGFEASMLIGRGYGELVHPEDLPVAAEVFLKQFLQHDAVGSLDARILHGDGTWKWYSIVTTNAIVDGQITGIIVNARDITERRLLLSQLEQANRVNGLGRLAATVAHEFNNVLMGMQPFAELMQRPGVSIEMAAKGAGYIASSIARGKRVALDILRFTQPAQPALDRVVLRDWWTHFLPEVKAGTENNVRLECDLDPELAIVADAGQLSQVFANLISNARHAMPNGGKLAVTARRPDWGETFSFGVVRDPHSCVQLSVSDTGCGIPAEIISNVFDPLFTTKRNGGTGLGLAVVHQIVTNHGGAIFVESTPGVGTTFHAFFPVAEAPELDASRTAAKVVPALRGPSRILIIDDEDAVAEGLSELLQAEGMTTATASTSAKGEIAAEQFRPDIVLIDVGLPDANGAETAVVLHQRYPALKVLIISGHADASGVLPHDPDMRFLQKPFSADALLEILHSFETESGV
jgi:PAS domain S-box-containing protein